MDEKSVISSAIAQLGESGGRFLDAPSAPEDVSSVEGAGAEQFGDTQKLTLVVTEDVHRVGFGWNTDVTGTRCPPPGRIKLGHDESVVIDHRPQIGVTASFQPSGPVVTAPERNTPEAGIRCGHQTVKEGTIPGQGARAEHQIGRSQGDPRHDTA
jgi:hypothetical protein